jgi:hypothetical protein
VWLRPKNVTEISLLNAFPMDFFILSPRKRMKESVFIQNHQENIVIQSHEVYISTIFHERINKTVFMFTEEFLASSRNCGKYELHSFKAFTLEEHFLQILMIFHD